MNLEKMGKSVDKDCLGRWERRRGMNGLLGLERRIRCSSWVAIEDMHVSRMVVIGYDEGPCSENRRLQWEDGRRGTRSRLLLHWSGLEYLKH